MLPLKPWKTDAVVRFVAGVFVCIYAGGLLATVTAKARNGGIDLKLAAVAVTAFVLLATTFFLLRVRWELERIGRQLGLLILCFYSGLALGWWAQQLAGQPGASVSQMVISALSFQGATLLLTGMFMREHEVSWGDAFGLDQRTLEAILYGVVLGCVFLPVAWGLQWISGEAMSRLPPWRSGPEEQQAVQTLKMASGLLERILLGVITVGIAPVAEEILFRGILYPWIKRIGFPRLALWVTCVLFAAIHLHAATFLPLLALAIALTLLYERTQNLLAPIAAHALFNALNFAALYLVERQWQWS